MQRVPSNAFHNETCGRGTYALVNGLHIQHLFYGDDGISYRPTPEKKYIKRSDLERSLPEVVRILNEFEMEATIRGANEIMEASRQLEKLR